MVTARDRIWATSLRMMEHSRTFTAADVLDRIDSNPPSKRTVRNTLDAMESLNLVESTGGSGRAPREYSPTPPNNQLQTPGYSPRDSTHSSPIPYPGSKGHIADWIISHMPRHDTYVEVFGGAAGVLFSKPRSKYEIYNDSDQDLVQFFRVLRERPGELKQWLTAVPYSRAQYTQWVTEFYDGHRPDDPIERAGRFFSLRYMQYIGVNDSPNGFKTRARRSPARTFDNARRRLQSLADRFSQVVIENRDYQSILSDYDDSAVNVLFYLDPPYRGAATHYDPAFDHDALLDCLQSVDNDWILSCAAIPPELTEYTIIERKARHRMRRSDDDVSERLICNFTPGDRQLFDDQHPE